jgi:polysaccharide export outer membrane protein
MPAYPQLLPLSLAFLFPYPSLVLPLSVGDRVEVSIPNDKYFAGVYEINHRGDIEIPYFGTFPAAGAEPDRVGEPLSRALIERGFFLPNQKR